jgi:hypothetical protein
MCDVRFHPRTSQFKILSRTGKKSDRAPHGEIQPE